LTLATTSNKIAEIYRWDCFKYVKLINDYERKEGGIKAEINNSALTNIDENYILCANLANYDIDKTKYYYEKIDFAEVVKMKALQTVLFVQEWLSRNGFDKLEFDNINES